jgi:hypothetical protein
LAKQKKKPFTFDLVEPITVKVGDKEEKITQLTVRPIKGKDFRVMNGYSNEVDAGMALLARACDQPIDVIDALDGEDWMTANSKLEEFVGKKRPQTGQTS